MVQAWLICKLFPWVPMFCKSKHINSNKASKSRYKMSSSARSSHSSPPQTVWKTLWGNWVPLESSLIEPIMPFNVLNCLLLLHVKGFSLRGIHQVVSTLWLDLLLLFDRMTRGRHPRFVIQLWPDRRRNADSVSGAMLPALCLLSCGNSFSCQPTTQLLLFKLCMIRDRTPSLSFCLAAVNEALCMYS